MWSRTDLESTSAGYIDTTKLVACSSGKRTYLWYAFSHSRLHLARCGPHTRVILHLANAQNPSPRNCSQAHKSETVPTIKIRPKQKRGNTHEVVTDLLGRIPDLFGDRPPQRAIFGVKRRCLLGGIGATRGDRVSPPRHSRQDIFLVCACSEGLGQGGQMNTSIFA